MNLETIKNKTILLFGKSRAFSSDEFDTQMKFHKIEVVRKYSDDVALIVDGKMMTPYEQNMSDELYEKQKTNAISIDVLEKELARFIDADTLLMSLKLSHDTDRLKDFLKNTMISDELFLRLLNIYSWDGEDFFENDNNRDVTSALIGRFYENIERNHNVEYATTGLYHLVSQTNDEKLLEIIATLEPIKNHKKIIQALLTHEKISKKIFEKFLKQDDKDLKKIMSYNPNLDKSIAKELIKNKDFVQIIARNINLDDELFELLLKQKKLMASNESLDENMQKKLLDTDNLDVKLALSSNQNLCKHLFKKLLECRDENIDRLLYANSACDEEILSQAYKDKKNHLYLASNRATPRYMLEKLSQSQDANILEKLAQNESTPIEILYQLQLDSKLERFVKTNAAFGRHIQSENIGWIV